MKEESPVANAHFLPLFFWVFALYFDILEARGDCPFDWAADFAYFFASATFFALACAFAKGSLPFLVGGADGFDLDFLGSSFCLATFFEVEIFFTTVTFSTFLGTILLFLTGAAGLTGREGAALGFGWAFWIFLEAVLSFIAFSCILDLESLTFDFSSDFAEVFDSFDFFESVPF